MIGTGGFVASNLWIVYDLFLCPAHLHPNALCRSQCTDLLWGGVVHMCTYQQLPLSFKLRVGCAISKTKYRLMDVSLGSRFLVSHPHVPPVRHLCGLKRQQLLLVTLRVAQVG